MSIAVVLGLADIFEDVGEAQLELVASFCTERTYKAEEIIFMEMAASDELYVIADGWVEIRVDPGLIGGQPTGEMETIAVLRRGQSFGEMSLVDQGLRSASAHAVASDTADKTRLVIIPRDKLMDMCSACTGLGFLLMRNLAADLAMKIRNNDLVIREQLMWARQYQEGGAA